MDTATLALPVTALVLLAVLVALTGNTTRRTPNSPHPSTAETRAPQLPDLEPPRPLQPRLGGLEPDEPLPPDQRAHLSWLAQHTDHAGVRAQALELLAVDDRRRGLTHLRRA